MNFLEACVAGEEIPDKVDDWIERWHTGGSDKELHEWLGMTWEEYGNWVSAPGCLAHIIEIRRLVGPARLELAHMAAKMRGGVN